MDEKGQNKTRNQVTVVGKIDKEFNFSHESYGEGFYKANILVDRLNDANDTIPVVVSDRLLDMDSCYAGKYVTLEGEFRSYENRSDAGEESAPRRHLVVFAHEVSLLKGEEPEKKKKEDNSINIVGYVSRPPVYRVTPMGREITQLLICVNRNYGKCDYIPCICWGRNAKFAAGFVPGDRISLSGRIQSREYTRKNSMDRPVKVTTHEVSVQTIIREEE